MEENRAVSSVGMYVTRGCLVVPIQVELHDDLVLNIQADVLKRVGGKGIRGVVIDLSGVAVLDSFLARKLFDTAKMTALMGAETVVTGIRPGAASLLVDLGFEPGDVPTAVNLEEGIRLLEPAVSPGEELDDAEEEEDLEELDAEMDQEEEGEMEKEEESESEREAD